MTGKMKDRKNRSSVTAPSSRERRTVKNVNVPGYTTTVDARMYEAMHGALRKVLPVRAPGLTQAEMFKAVLEQLPQDLFPGGAKASWWVKTVQLDQEAKGTIVREAVRPLRWHRRKRA